MKKIGIVGLLVVLMWPLEAPIEAASLNTGETIAMKPAEGLRKKKGYRKKKGFMWGLFRKTAVGALSIK